MQDFQISNKTKLLFRNDPSEEIANFTKNKKVLFVYGGGSVHKNGCYDDVKASVLKGQGQFFEFGNASREITDIQKGVQFCKENKIECLIGAGGASVMDAAKVISIGSYNDDFWERIKSEKGVEELQHLPLILIPTYPSSGSEYDDAAVVSEKERFNLTWGINSDLAILVPKYSISLNQEMTSYSSLVTITQLSSFIVCDRNPISYDFGISVVKNVLKAAQTLKTKLDDLTARSVILYAASISKSGWIGLDKEVDFSLDFYMIQFIMETLFNESYRKTLTILFPRLLKHIAIKYKNDVKKFLNDAFGFNGPVDDSINKLIQLFSDFGVDMYLHKDFTEEKLAQIPNKSKLSKEEISTIFKNSIKI